jgi:hypothetical protein
VLTRGSSLDISPKGMNGCQWVVKVKKKAKITRIEERDPQ